MLVSPAKYVRKPFAVEAVEVTDANIEDVAQWCGGEIRISDGRPGKNGPTGQQKFIKVQVKRPLNDRQTRAYPGDWILSAGTGFKVYTAKAFSGSFEEQTDRMFDVIERMEERADTQDQMEFELDYTEPQVREALEPQFDAGTGRGVA